jgi:tetratricopeptide (TPR) repeat protein
MKSSYRMPGLVLTGVLLTAFFVLNGCAPKAVPLGATLDSPEHHILSGLKLLKLGRYDDALREFDLTKQSDPTFSKAYVGCGLVFAHLEKWERAFQELEKGEKLARTDEEKVFASVGAITPLA